MMISPATLAFLLLAQSPPHGSNGTDKLGDYARTAVITVGAASFSIHAYIPDSVKSNMGDGISSGNGMVNTNTTAAYVRVGAGRAFQAYGSA